MHYPSCHDGNAQQENIEDFIFSCAWIYVTKILDTRRALTIINRPFQAHHASICIIKECLH